MPEARPSSKRHQKIEPLSWELAAQSPALKGMTSFLDISPEDVRRNNFDGFGPLRLAKAPLLAATTPDTVSYAGDETYAVRDTALGYDRARRQASKPLELLKSHKAGTSSIKRTLTGQTSRRVEPVPTVDKTTAIASSPAADNATGNEMPPGLVSSPGYGTYAENKASPLELERGVLPLEALTPPRRQDEPVPAVDTSTAIASGPAADNASGDELYPGVVSSPEYETYARDATIPRGLERNVLPLEILTPGRGRSKIRRCVLAQDGHSLGEEAIYQVLWRTGRAENSDPNGSRTNRMGAADIGYKVNMAKKNVRQNISRLFEKLALEIIEDFETINSQARLYRVYSYKQILERRRSAGLEYVLRNKGVVFCSKDGSELVASPAYVSTPGDETSIKPAAPKKRRTVTPVELFKYPQTALKAAPIGASDETDVRAVSLALNRYWTVDEAAAVQLLRACRQVRSDARADEIAFFVQEKLDLARTSRTITNPTGLILAMVPQSFRGVAFEDFRKRMESRTKLAAEEAERKSQQEAELNAWMIRDRERYEAIVGDASKPERERDEAEKRLREIDAWNR